MDKTQCLPCCRGSTTLLLFPRYVASYQPPSYPSVEGYKSLMGGGQVQSLSDSGVMALIGLVCQLTSWVEGVAPLAIPTCETPNRGSLRCVS